MNIENIAVHNLEGILNEDPLTRQKRLKEFSVAIKDMDIDLRIKNRVKHELSKYKHPEGWLSRIGRRCKLG